MGVDHGFRNPEAWVWGAIDGDDNIYIYREFYEREWDVEEVIKGKKDKDTGKRIQKGTSVIMRNEKIDCLFIDPSVKARQGGKGGSLFDEYLEQLEESSIAVGLARSDKVWVRHEKINANDLQVILRSAAWLAEKVRDAEQDAASGE